MVRRYAEQDLRRKDHEAARITNSYKKISYPLMGGTHLVELEVGHPSAIVRGFGVVDGNGERTTWDILTRAVRVTGGALK